MAGLSEAKELFQEDVKMRKTIKRSMILAGVALFVPAVASAQIQGNCADCHTMHNSEQNAPVAMTGVGANTLSSGPIQNLLRMDCIACHAQDPAGPKIAVLDSGSAVPQVYHGDATGDLAAGNFMHIVNGGDSANRKGHNVSDLFPGGDDTGGAYTMPPGKYYPTAHNTVFTAGGTPFDRFTCAGAAGCHGTRSQALVKEGIVGSTDPATNTTVKRTGISAVSGAHHNSTDGVKDPAQNISQPHSGAQVGASYRFIAGLKGTGNADARWQNVSSTSHNEYFGAPASPGTGCAACHVETTLLYNGDGNKRMQLDSTLKVPNQGMSGFCITCHGQFHSSSLEAETVAGRFNYNGTGGAFLRHPSDYVIPSDTNKEYKDYTVFNVTAPVARQTLATAALGTVAPGSDLVMCLSCHQAHATPYDGMLRFDYDAIIAGTTTAKDGCLACHTTKGAK
jgi:hypothetical protein